MCSRVVTASETLCSSWLTLVGLKETLSKTPSMLSMKCEFFLKQKSVHSLSRMKLNVSGLLILFMLNLLLQEKLWISNWKHKTRVRDFNGEVQSFVLKKWLFKLHQTQILLFWVSVTVNNYYSNVHTTWVCSTTQGKGLFLVGVSPFLTPVSVTGNVCNYLNDDCTGDSL